MLKYLRAFSIHYVVCVLQCIALVPTQEFIMRPEVPTGRQRGITRGAISSTIRDGLFFKKKCKFEDDNLTASQI